MTSPTKDRVEGMLLLKKKIPKNNATISFSDDTEKVTPTQNVASKNDDRIGQMCENTSDMRRMIANLAGTVEVLQKRVKEVTKKVTKCWRQLINVLSKVQSLRRTGIMIT